MASICSVTFMDPTSAGIPDPPPPPTRRAGGPGRGVEGAGGRQAAPPGRGEHPGDPAAEQQEEPPCGLSTPHGLSEKNFHPARKASKHAYRASKVSGGATKMRS